MDHSDYTTYIEPLRPRMVNGIWRIVRDADDTEDVLQDVLVKIAKDIGRIRRHPSSTALVLRMCTNAAIDCVRKKNKGARIVDADVAMEDLHSGNPSPSDKAMARERHAQVLAAIRKLPPREAEAIILLTIEDLPYTEVAQAMECRESTARVLVTKARKRLKEILSQETQKTSCRITEMEA